MTHWRIDTASDLSPSRQLVETVLDALVAGKYVPGDKLPSVRGLAAQALVNSNTVARAYRELEHLGAVRGENGRGVYVTEQAPRVARDLRKNATLAAFLRTAHEALRAGHSPQELQQLLIEESSRQSA